MRKILVLLLSFLLLISCQKEVRDYLPIAVSSEPVTLDMQINSSLIARTILVGNVYEKLFVLDGEGNVRCELAESYTISEDSHTLRVVIRDGVLFHNGREMSVEDVSLSMNRFLDSYGTAALFTGDSRFIIIDEKTIELTSSKSLALFPYLVAAAPQSAVIVPKEDIADGSLDEGIGTGPYMLKEWKSGEDIELEKFPSYVPYSTMSSGAWGEKRAEIEKLRYYFVSDAVTRRLGLESGLYSFINDVMSQDIEAFEKNEKIDLLSSGETGMIALVYNKKEGISSDKEFRKAAAYLFDSENIMRACYGESGYSIHSDYMEAEQTMWISGKDNPYDGVDYSKSAEHLSSSSYDGEKVRILTSNLSNMDKLALAAASDLEKGGIKSEVIAVDWASMMEIRKDSSRWDIFISAFSQVPLPQLKSFLNPEFPGWIEDEDIALVKSLMASSSEKEAVARWSEIEPLLWDSLVVYVPGHYETMYASSGLEGVIVQNGFYFWNAKFN